MAIPADTVWEVNTTGSDTAAGGGFSIGQKGATGTDMTYPTPAVTTFTSNLSATGTTTLTCSAALFLNTMLGNVIQISSQGFYCIQGFTSTTVVTVDRALGTFSTTSGWVGGALASPGQAAAVATVSGNRVYIKTGAYSITSASTNISGGCAAFALVGVIEGYQATRGDFGTPPVFTASGIATATLIANSTNDGAMRNLSVDGAALTAIRGISVARGTHYKLKAVNCTNSGLFSVSTGILIGSSATGCSTAGSGITGFSVCIACESYSNTVGGFTVGTYYVQCLAYANSGASSDGFVFNSQNGGAINSSAYNNGRDGFRSSIGSGGVIGIYQNCIAEGNGVSSGTGWGFNSSTNVYINLINCAAFGNQSGAVNAPAVNLGFNIGFVTGTASFFIAPGSGNFALNTTAGGGAAARAAGIPGLFPRGLTTGYLDIGAAQHADPVKLLTVAGMTGGME